VVRGSLIANKSVARLLAFEWIEVLAGALQRGPMSDRCKWPA
jgi:hypothetical protein